MSDIEWRTLHENELGLADHEAIAAMLSQAFPRWSHWYAGGRSWAGMEPERRVVARDEHGVVLAHAGVRRMFLDADGEDLLVGCVGLVAVTPSLQRAGLGRQVMARTDELLTALAVPFGLLQTGEDRVAFYGECGWELLEGSVFTRTAPPLDGAGLPVTDDENWLIRPVSATADAWPGGAILVDGQLV